jgi:hypothetical protein
MTKTKENKVDHYKATENMNESDCLKYCKNKAKQDQELFPDLSFDKDKLIDGYMKMYYQPKKAAKNESKVLLEDK